MSVCFLLLNVLSGRTRITKHYSTIFIFPWNNRKLLPNFKSLKNNNPAYFFFKIICYLQYSKWRKNAECYRMWRHLTPLHGASMKKFKDVPCQYSPFSFHRRNLLPASFRAFLSLLTNLKWSVKTEKFNFILTSFWTS